MSDQELPSITLPPMTPDQKAYLERIQRDAKRAEELRKRCTCRWGGVPGAYEASLKKCWVHGRLAEKVAFSAAVVAAVLGAGWFAHEHFLDT